MADDIDSEKAEGRARTVTLHDVAAAAGVSIATVSRALNGLPVSKDALRKVENAADQLGYVANEAARSLRSDRSMTMGLIFRRLVPASAWRCSTP